MPIDDAPKPTEWINKGQSAAFSRRAFGSTPNARPPRAPSPYSTTMTRANSAPEPLVLEATAASQRRTSQGKALRKRRRAVSSSLVKSRLWPSATALTGAVFDQLVPSRATLRRVRVRDVLVVGSSRLRLTWVGRAIRVRARAWAFTAERPPPAPGPLQILREVFVKAAISLWFYLLGFIGLHL